MLVTNVACYCGYTSGNYKVGPGVHVFAAGTSSAAQYALMLNHNQPVQELVDLHNKYNGQGLEIVAFPCNQVSQAAPAANDAAGSQPSRTLAV